mgnify:CR=1 FL=1
MKYIYGRGPVIEALKNEEVEKIYVGKNATGSIKKIIGMARDLKVPTVTSDIEKLEELAGTKNHQAVVALVSDFKYIELEDLINKLEGITGKVVPKKVKEKMIKTSLESRRATEEELIGAGNYFLEKINRMA